MRISPEQRAYWRWESAFEEALRVALSNPSKLTAKQLVARCAEIAMLAEAERMKRRPKEEKDRL